MLRPTPTIVNTSTVEGVIKRDLVRATRPPNEIDKHRQVVPTGQAVPHKLQA